MYEELTERIEELRSRNGNGSISSHNLFDLIPIVAGYNYMGTIRKTIQSFFHYHSELIMFSNGAHKTLHNKIKQQKLLLDLRRFLWV